MTIDLTMTANSWVSVFNHIIFVVLCLLYEKYLESITISYWINNIQPSYIINWFGSMSGPLKDQ